MFSLTKKSKITKARLGVLKTQHGYINTPAFIPVATQGAIKHVSTEEIKKLNSQILLSNTYHLMLKPGSALIKKAGGLHRFMNWQGPILTDSGGFQIFSLAGNKTKSGESLVKLKPNGVKFKSYIDGKQFYLTPEKALKIQLELGVDIAVCLDECVALPAKKEKLDTSVKLTTLWAKRTKQYFLKTKKHYSKQTQLFAVIQGGLNKQLRLKCVRELLKIGFDGYNIGGLSVGETPEQMYQVLDYLAPEMPENKPRYLMGVGYPENIVEAVKRGVDMFDCVIPTREGRHGRLFLLKKNCKFEATSKQLRSKLYNTFNITRSKFARDFTPINPNSKLPDLRNLSRAYLHYLFKVKEPISLRLASLHNLEFYLDLMKIIRYHIKHNLL